MEKSNNLKTLLKIAIGFGAFSVVCIVALTIAAVVWFRSITSPAHVKSVAATFMTIADPLPKGFTYTAAYEVSGLPILQIGEEGEPSLYTFTFADDPIKKQGKNLAVLSVEDRAADLERSLTIANKGRLTPKITDKLRFANETMCYSIGHTELLGPDSTINNGFSGIAQSSKTGKYLLLWVEKQGFRQNNSKAIDLMRIKELLSAIKSF